MAEDVFGFVGTMAAISPEISALVDRAKAESWTPDYFQNMLIGTAWYKNASPAIRQYQTLAATDPGGLEQKIAQQTASIQELANTNGVNLDAHLWGLHATQYGLNADQITQMIRSVAHVGNSNQVFGQSQQVYAQLKKYAQSYGQSYSDADYMTWTQKVMQQGDDGFGGKVDINYMLNWYQRVAQNTFPGLRDQLDAGMTVQDVAQPYIKSMSQTLEIPETEVTILDPTIRKALTTFTTNKKDGTAFSSQPMWEFEQGLKNDPRWDRTKNAAQSAYDTVGQIGRDFGFVGS